MKTSRSPRIQVLVEFLVTKYKIDYPNIVVTAEKWKEIVQNSADGDEVFNYAWIKITPYEREYIRRKVECKVSKNVA